MIPQMRKAMDMLQMPEKIFREFDNGKVKNIKLLLGTNVAKIEYDGLLNMVAAVDGTRITMNGVVPNNQDYLAILDAFDARYTGDALTKKYVTSSYEHKPLFLDNYSNSV